MRLIDADAAVEQIEKEIESIKAKIDEWESSRKDREGYHDVDARIVQYQRNITHCKVEIAMLRSYPTVDAVPVVRCKDCQYSHEPSVLVKGLVECEKSCSGECLKREDWYCPLGERRGD